MRTRRVTARRLVPAPHAPPPAIARGATVAVRVDRAAAPTHTPDAMRILDPQSLSQHVDRLYRAAWGLCGSREDAEDLVQETFARVLSRQRVLHGDDDLYYLMRVLRNTFLTSRRTAGRRPVTVATLEDVVTADPKPMGRPEQALEVQEVYATIAELPEDFRMALVAVDVLGLSYREAARALRVREATITTRLFRARKQVAKQLTPEPGPQPQPGEGPPDALDPSSRRGEPATARRERMQAGGVLPSRELP
jgi:RNA polymerase sigma-70 factor, ECF subfamily